MTPWEIKGRELVNCTCEYGCNCQLNALPDKGRSASSTTKGPVKVETKDTYGQFARLHLNNHGVVRD